MKRLVLALVAAALLAGAAITAVLVLKDDDTSAVVDPAMLVAARQEATNFFTLDFNDAEGSTNRVLELATSPFKEEYAARKAEVIAQLKAKKLTCAASIPDDGAAIEFLDGDHAQVLVVVEVPETATCRPDASQNRTRLLLTKVDGRWLVSGFNRVG